MRKKRSGRRRIGMREIEVQIIARVAAQESGTGLEAKLEAEASPRRLRVIRYRVAEEVLCGWTDASAGLGVGYLKDDIDGGRRRKTRLERNDIGTCRGRIVVAGLHRDDRKPADRSSSAQDAGTARDHSCLGSCR